MINMTACTCKKNIKLSKRVLALLLSFILCITSFDITVFAGDSGDVLYNGVYYENVYDALKKARDEEDKDIDIYVYKDITLNKGIEVYEGENIYLHGEVLEDVQDTDLENTDELNQEEDEDTGSGNNEKIKITLSDDFDYDYIDNAYMLNIEAGGSFTMDNFEFSAGENRDSSKYAFYNLGNLSVKNSKINGYIFEGASVIYQKNATLDLTGTNVMDITLSNKQAFIKSEGTSSINGGKFSGVISDGGKGSCIWASGLLTVEGVEASDCRSNYGGFLYSEYTVVGENLHVSDCYANSYAGAMYVGEVYLNNCYFEGNVGSSSGGAIRKNGKNTSEIYNTTFVRNNCGNKTGNGSTLDYAVDTLGNINMSGVCFDGEICGGGLRVQRGCINIEESGEHETTYFGKIETSRNVFKNNKGDSAIHIESNGYVVVDDCDFIDNSYGNGGAIYDTGYVELHNASFSGNVATNTCTNNLTTNKGDDVYCSGSITLCPEVKFNDEGNIHVFLTKGKYVSIGGVLKNHTNKDTSINIAVDEAIADSSRKICEYVSTDDEELSEDDLRVNAFEAAFNGVFYLKSVSEEDNENIIAKDNEICLETTMFSKSIKCVDNNGNLISDVVVEIYRFYDDDNYKKIGISGSSDSDGIITINKLISGKYGVKIISAPQDYVYESTFVSFAVDMDSEEETIVNVGRYNEAPVAKITLDKGEVEANEEVAISASLSSDDVGIKSYKWDWGDGKTSTGLNCSHKYTAGGVYLIILTVTDTDGRTGSDTTLITVTSEGMVSLTVNVKSSSTDEYINSYVYLTDSNDEVIAENTSKTGVFVFMVDAGNSVRVSALADGYYSRSTCVTCTKDKEITLYLSDYETIEGKLTATDMTYEEIVEAGINIDDEDNCHIVKYSLGLEFMGYSLKEADEEIDIPEFVYYQNQDTEEITIGSGREEYGDYYIKAKDVKGKVYLLVINGTNKWLKDMFDVKLIVINTSTKEVAKDVEATLNLPEGLSLADMLDGSNREKTKKLGDIPCESTSFAQWYVRGDEDGVYEISASVTGSMHLSEEGVATGEETVDDYEFSYVYVCEKPLVVTAGNALALNIDLDYTTSTDDYYEVKFTYTNKSNKTLNGLRFFIDSEKQCSPKYYNFVKYTRTRAIPDGNGGVEVIEEGKLLDRVDELGPGESVTVTYSTYIRFLDENGEPVLLLLMSWGLSILEGSTTSMDVTFNINISAKDRANLYKMYEQSVKAYGADPVNIVTGDYEYTETDFTVYGCRNLDFIRYYNSANDEDCGLGTGWRHNYSYEVLIEETEESEDLEENSDSNDEEDLEENENLQDNAENKKILPNTLNIMNPESEIYTFNREEEDETSGFYSGKNGKYVDVYKEDGKVLTYVLHDKEGDYTFNDKGKLTNITYKDNYEIELNYNGTRLIEVSAENGTFTLAWEELSNHITEITVNDEKEKYAYKSDKLISVTDFNNNDITYEYDGKLKSITDYEGNIILNNKYDGNGRVIEQKSADGETYTFSYDDTNRINREESTLGKVREVTYDEYFRITSDVENGEVSYTYNALGLPIIIEDMDGKTYFSYNGNGDIRKIIYPDGTMESFSYSGFDLIKKTDRNGNSEEYTYNTDGLLIYYTDVNGHKEKYKYNDNHKLIQIRKGDNEEQIQNLSYDAKGNVSKITDACGIETTFVYDDFGRKIKEEYEDGAYISFTYSKKGQIISETDEKGNAITTSYDKNGNCISTSDKKGQSETISYNTAQRRSEMVSREGYVTKFEYDESGNISRVTYDNDGKREYTYDLKGNLISYIDAVGRKESYNYDDKGRMVSKTNNYNDAEEYVYDSNNRLISKTNYDGSTISYEYDYNGNLIKEINEEGFEKSYEYDAKGNVIKESDYNGNVIIYAYDAFDNVIKSESGNVRTEYAYDLDNRLLSITTQKIDKTDARENEVTKTTVYYEYNTKGLINKITDENGKDTLYQYNDTGKVISITYPDESVVSFAYDENGNNTSFIDGRGNETTYAYDKEDRLIKETDSLGRETTYSYDCFGNITKIVYPNGNEVVNEYDNESDLLTTYSGNTISSFTYDELGRPIIKKISDGGNEGDKTESVEEKYDYDSVGNITGITDGNGNVRSYEYDKSGNIIKTVDACGNSITYEYDGLGNVVKENHDNGLVIEYLYDEFCNVIKKTEHDVEEDTNLSDNGEKTYKFTKEYIYEYDINNNVIKYTDACGHETCYEYDNKGNNTKIISANGDYVTYDYDDMNRVIREQSSGNTDIRYEYDENGNLVTITDSEGRVKSFSYDECNNLIKETKESEDEYRETSYKYDLNNRLIKVTFNDGSCEKYEYDENDNVISKTDRNGNETDYNYDYRDNLIKVVNPEGDSTSYKYDDNNNLISVIMSDLTTDYEYNGLNQLVTITRPDGNVTSYTYDAEGNVKNKYVNGEKSVDYEYDIFNNTVKKETYVPGDENAVNTYKYCYDKINNLILMEDAKSSVEIIRDELDRIMTVRRKTTTSTEDEDSESEVDLNGDLDTVYQEVTTYEYDKDGNKKVISLPDGEKVTYEYNANSEIVSVNNNENTYGYEYNDFGEVVSKDDGEKTYTYEYDNTGNLKNIFEDGILSDKYVYDYNGNITRHVSLNNSESYVYDKDNRLVKESIINDKINNGICKEKSYEYDDYGNLILEMTDDTSIEYTYENSLLMEKETADSSLKTSFEYDGEGNLLSKTYGDTKEEYTYDGEGKLVDSQVVSSITKVSNSVKEDYNYRDVYKNVTSEYSYDGIGNLLEKETESYDCVNNKKIANNSIDEKQYEKTSEEYKQELFSYDYTEQNPRIIHMNISETDKEEIEKSYTDIDDDYVENKRIDKSTQTEHKSIEASFVYGNEKLAVNLSYESIPESSNETNGEINNEINEESTDVGNVISEKLSLKLKTDNLGSVIGFSESDTNISGLIIYDSWGDVILSETQKSDIINDVLNNSPIIKSFTTYVYDKELSKENTSWYAYARFYSSGDRRFESPDPNPGNVYETLRINSYIYAGNNPITYMDPDGNSFICNALNNRYIKPIVKLVNDIVDTGKEIAGFAIKAMGFMDKIPTEYKYLIGGTCALAALALGVPAAVVAGAIIQGTFSGLAFGAASYTVSSLINGNFDIKECVNSAFNGAADMFMLSGVSLGVKGAYGFISENTQSIKTFLSEEGGYVEIGEGGSGATFEGTIYRSVNKQYNPLEMSQYTINSNHRYTEKGVPGLYFSSGEKIVKAELGNYDVTDFSNRIMYSYDVKLTNMLDVSNPSIRKKLGVSLDSIVGESYDVTHTIGRYANSNGYNGIIAPSARADGGVNIILFNTKEVK